MTEVGTRFALAKIPEDFHHIFCIIVVSIQLISSIDSITEGRAHVLYAMLPHVSIDFVSHTI